MMISYLFYGCPYIAINESLLQNQFHKGKIEKKAMYKLNYILLVVFAVIYTGCTHKKVQKINADIALYEKICATEVPK